MDLTASSNVAYDADGNYVSGPIPYETGNATLAWDAENRLVAITRATSTAISYSYDPFGRRICKKVGKDAASFFIYDGWNLIAEYVIEQVVDPEDEEEYYWESSLDRLYTWGMDMSGSLQGAGGVGGLLSVKVGSSTYYPTYDGNGNVSEYLDASGAAVAHYEYDAFGNTTASSGSSFAHRFSTKYLDAETGLYYYGFRYGDPVTGRWVSRDPIGERGGMNLYVFVGNNGITETDLLGKSLNRSPLPNMGYMRVTYSGTVTCELTGLFSGCCPGPLEIRLQWKSADFPSPGPLADTRDAESELLREATSQGHEHCGSRGRVCITNFKNQKVDIDLVQFYVSDSFVR